MAVQERPRYAQDFFKQLVSPLQFPRGEKVIFRRLQLKAHIHFIISDYVGFIKKIMKLMQNEFPMFRKIEVELTQEKDIEKIPDRPSK